MKAKVIERSETASVVTSDQLLREEAIDAKNMVERGYMKLARCLYDIYKQNVYTKWDYITFEGYVDAELQINYRKAMYLIEIYNKAKMLDMDMERLEKLGWTKARELLKVVDQQNADEWMSTAENSTVKELNIQIRQEKDKSELSGSVIDEVPTITSVTFKMGMVEHGLLKDALDESQRLINSTDPVLALANICMEWAEMKGVVPLQTPLEDRILFMEKAYGVKLVVSGKASSLGEDDDDEFTLVEDEDNEFPDL